MSEPLISRSELWQKRRKRVRRVARRILPFLSGMLAAFLALFAFTALNPPPRPLDKNDIATSIAGAMASATEPPAYSALVYQVIAPSLVLIQSQVLESNGLAAADGLGTGVIVNDQGNILTSLHVVANQPSLVVTFADGSQSPAKISATQPENDIAVLSADQLPEQFIPATLGNPNAMHVGDEAYVVGHPFSLYDSMSAGVISGFKRTFQIPDTGQNLTDLIQVDAAINPGNSGGPLVNRAGQVIGIVTALLNPTKQNVFIGIGFAVPITTAGGAAGAPPV